MKYIIFIIVGVFSTISSFAATLEISTDSKKYNIDDTIRLIIEIESKDDRGGELQVTGIENNFHVVGQSQNTQTQNINGEIQQKQYFNIALLGYEAGEFNIGPVILSYEDGETITSNTLSITLSGERIMVNPNLPHKNLQSGSGKTGAQDLSQIKLGDNSLDSGEVKDVTGLDGEPMQDIYDIKPNLLPKPYRTITIFIALGATAIAWFSLYFWKKLSQVPLINKPKQKKSINYSSALKKIEKKYITESGEVFYGQIGQLFRAYLDDKVSYGLSGKSLSEVKYTLNSLSSKGEGWSEVLEIYSDIYFPAYNNKVNGSSSRKKMIAKLQTIFNKT